MVRAFVIFSLTKSLMNPAEEPMFWSRLDGWVPLWAATRYPSTEYDLPRGDVTDAQWVLLSEE